MSDAPIPSVEKDAEAIMRMLVAKKGLKAGERMPNALILAYVLDLGLAGARRADALTFAGDQAWLESRDNGLSEVTQAGYHVGITRP
jgi:hypothetical protein